MRYLKVLLLAVFLFFAMVFFFQNQVPLSQDVILTLNLFFIPTFTSIAMPFYFIVIAAFLVGSVLTLCMLLWDRWSISARAMRRQWRINSLEKEVESLRAQVAKQAKEFAESTAAHTALPQKTEEPDEKKPA